jgi:hypothetical protein
VAQVSAAMHEFPADKFKYVLAAPYVVTNSQKVSSILALLLVNIPGQ